MAKQRFYASLMLSLFLVAASKKKPSVKIVTEVSCEFNQNKCNPSPSLTVLQFCILFNVIVETLRLFCK